MLIEFELQGCDVTLNCQRTFNTHVYETSSVDSAAARNTNNYRQVERVSPGNIGGGRVNETVTINFSTDSSSFYFAIQDEASCIAVTRVIVFYTVCPGQAVDMISYPLTVAPLTGITTISTSCVENAEPVGDDPKVACSTDASWNALTSQCRCRPGAFSVSGACIRKWYTCTTFLVFHACFDMNIIEHMQSVLLERTYLQAVESAHRVLLTVSVIETDLLSVFVTLATTEHQEKRTYLADVCCTLCIHVHPLLDFTCSYICI